MSDDNKLYKLLSLALNKGADEGEWHTAAIKFIGKLRKDCVSPDDVKISTGADEQRESSFSFADFFSSMSARSARQEAQRRAAQYGNGFAGYYEKPPQPPPPTYESHSDFRMPFGKYKGQRLGDIPPGYLSWLNEWLVRVGGFEALQDALREELTSRNMQYV